MRRLALVVVCVALAACGGGGGSSDDTGGVPVPNDSGNAAGVFDAAKCADAARALASAASAVPAAVTGNVGANFEQSVQQLEAFADAAPEEIRDDLKTIAQGYADFAKALSDAGFDPGSGQPPAVSDLQGITAAAQKLNTADFKAAVDHVNQWFRDECSG